MLYSLFRSDLRGLGLLALLSVASSVTCAVEGNGNSGDFASMDPGKIATGDAATGGLPPVPGAGAGGSTAESSTAASSSGSSGSSGSGCGPDIDPPNVVLPDTTDPEAGDFTLDEALAGLPEGPGPLRAILDMDPGSVTCELRPDKAPIGVANFVGLARGTRAWKDPSAKKWVKRPFYDGLLIMLVEPGKYIWSGDFFGNGKGTMGYTVKDELSDLKNVPGTLGYVHVATGVYDALFYIAAASLPTEDGVNTVFGLCAPASVMLDISNVPHNTSTGKPTTDIRLKKVTITRCAP